MTSGQGAASYLSVIFQEPAIGEPEQRVLEHIRHLWQKLKYNLRNSPARWTGLLARNLKADAIRGSNGIEGYLVSKEDALAAVDGVEPQDAGETAWINVEHYREAMEYILRLGTVPDFSYSRDLIRSLHYIMLRHDPRANPGSWRQSPIFVRKTDTAEVVYVGAPVDQVPTLMKDLSQYLTRRDDHQPTRMIRAAMAHLNLTMIHPFSDGNGRMARALQSLVLARGGVLDPTFCSIEEYLGAHRQEYYAVLAEVGGGTWHPYGDPAPWVRFCLTAHYRQAKTAQRKLAELAAIGEDVERELARLGLPDRAAPALVNAVRGERLRNPSYRVAVGVSQLVASRDLKLLSDAGLLVPAGDNRGRHYAASPHLLAATEGHVDRTPIEDPFDGSTKLPESTVATA